MAEVVRVRYTEGQFLGVDDLVAEQDHRDGAARRHLLAAHPWGVVSGLALSARPGGGTTVGPGVAVDGYGRTLRVTEPVDLPAGAGARDVWLSLVDDVATVCIAPAGPVDPHHPPGVPPDLPAQPPHAAVGPAPGPWPVFLGRVPAAGAPKPDGRVLAGLVGEEVRAPSGRARLQLGPESTADPTRFTIATEQPDGPPRVRVGVDVDGDLTVHGPARFDGDLAVLPIEQGGIGFAPAPTPAQAAPWSWYRTRVERDGRPVDQLRIEIGHPGDGGDPATQRFVVGVHGRVKGSDTFLPCLSVDAAGTVTVHGKLRVGGLLSEGPIGTTDPRVVAAAGTNFASGVLGTAAELAERFAAARFFVPTLKVSLEGDTDAFAGHPFAYKVTVSNTGTAPATHSQLFVVVGINRDRVSTERVLDDVTIAPGPATAVNGVFAVPGNAANSELTVDVRAVGVSPVAAVVDAQAVLTRTVKSKPIP